MSSKLDEIELLKNEFASLAVFVCGSYGRLEAHKNSDLDVFFVNTYSPDLKQNEVFKTNLSRLNRFRLWARFLEITESIGFPAPTDDGKYLVVHELHDIREHLGGQQDDATNEFTTRMLLLLESRPVANGVAYEKLIETVVGAYFTDYHDHEKNFQPVFLLNDIIRYWKTMCLNYEHSRRLKAIRPEGLSDEEYKKKRAEVHLKNLKLKYSRLMICYSMVVAMSAIEEHSREKIVDLIKLTPIQRLEKLRDHHPFRVDVVLKAYASFLAEVSHSEIKTQLQDKSYRNEQFEAARNFSKSMYDLLNAASDKSILRYITI